MGHHASQWHCMYVCMYEKLYQVAWQWTWVPYSMVQTTTQRYVWMHAPSTYKKQERKRIQNKKKGM